MGVNISSTGKALRGPRCRAAALLHHHLSCRVASGTPGSSAGTQEAGLARILRSSQTLRLSSRWSKPGSMDTDSSSLHSEEGWQRVSRGMKEVLSGHGIDIVIPFSVAWYNSVVPPALRLSWLGRTQPPLGVVVGNSRALWAPFVDALGSQPNLRQDDNPLNTYIKKALDEALSGFAILGSHAAGDACTSGDTLRALIYWAHDTAPGKLVAMQRLAHLAGIAFFDEESHLCVHPKYGAWFALRAVVVLDLDPPKEEPQPLGNLLDDDAKARVKAAMKLAMEQPKAVQHDDCGGRSKSFRSIQHDLGHWRLWLAVRDAIAPDHPWRYCEEQIEYHYTGNRLILDKILSGDEAV